MKILLADADVNTRERLRARLEKRGYYVLGVADGHSALNHLLHSEGPWIAVIDADLPVWDGISICKRIQQSAQQHSVYIVLRSNKPTPQIMARGLGAGADDFVSKTCHRRIFRARLCLAERLLRTRHALAERATHDTLTALPNRMSIIERLGRSVTLAQQDPRYHFVVLHINIDRFKVINDSLGHASGNLLMKKIAGRLVHSIRTHRAAAAYEDRREQLPHWRDAVARLDGDEFIILLENMNNVEDGVTVANRINAALRRGFRINDDDVSVSASIGIATSRGPAGEATDILRAADTAMNKAKLQGRARYEVATSELSSTRAGHLKLESGLRFAPDRGEFEPRYQPTLDLSKTGISRFEALLRWQHPTRGIVPPSTSELPRRRNVSQRSPAGVLTAGALALYA